MNCSKNYIFKDKHAIYPSMERENGGYESPQAVHKRLGKRILKNELRIDLVSQTKGRLNWWGIDSVEKNLNYL